MQQATSRSVKSDMTASNAESWARLRLVQGESSTQKWELTATQGNATVTVGTSPDCTWVVQDEGVRAVHFSLHWDGRTLRIADVYSAGDVRVDGALLSSQWLPLLGRVRIEFGNAAMVAESASGAVISEASGSPFPEIVHDSTPPVPSARPSAAAPRSTVKGTLIGVAPNTVLPSYLQAPSPAGTSASEPPSAPASGQAGETSRPRAPAGSLKATLVGGVAIGGAPAGVAKNKPNATLMGFNAAEVLRGVVGTPSVPVGGSSVPDGPVGGLDQRTVQGFPAVGSSGSSVPPASSPVIAGRRMTQKGVISRPPGVLEGAVAHVPVRAVSEPAPGSAAQARIGSAWQEVPEADAFIAEPIEGEQPIPRPPRTPRISTAPWDIADRLSEIPTQMRDHASFATSRRRRRGLRWHHVAVLLLTVTAYFAWLYLLDHW